ncbi:hypothetical protein [Pseudalkalibacillus sp. SCS-8]|uniref:hypothetical protein n=1 Tax=Pseudalkalibacillus nanhaiensis TaxID=3115291 RepID=UPI0032DB71A7
MSWIGQYEGLIFMLTNFVVFVLLVLLAVYVLFTEEGRRFRKAKKNREPIRKEEYPSTLRKVILVLAGGVAPLLFVLGILSHMM